MKVRYQAINGQDRTAYIEDEPNADGIYEGEEKHSEEPVYLMLNKDHSWTELPSRMLS